MIYIMKIKDVFLVCIFSCLCACSKDIKRDDQGIPVLSGDIDQQSVGLSELFNKIEVLPIETSDSCLLIDITKIATFDNKLFVFDRKQSAVIIFDNEGRFIQKLDKKGQGPDEYTMIYDFYIDTCQYSINMLSPFGALYSYDKDMQLIKKVYLPDGIPNFQQVNYIDSSRIAVWSTMTETENAISIIDKNNGKPITGFWKENLIINSFNSSGNFYSYENQLYFAPVLLNDVFLITPDSLKKVYKWDFGEKTTDIYKYNFSTDYPRDFASDEKQLVDDIKQRVFGYFLRDQQQTKDYYYATLSKDFKDKNHLFYSKSDWSMKLFSNQANKINFKPLIFKDEYILGQLDYVDIDVYRNSQLLDEKSFSLLDSYTEDSNPWVVKYYFRR